MSDDRPLVPKGVLQGIKNLAKGNTASKDELQAVMKHPRCDYCGFPAVCYGADLVNPKHRCPRCCNRDFCFKTHGSADYLEAHLRAEGISLA